MPRFDPFVLFWVLRHRTQIQFLRFVLGSPTSCPNFIIFSGIVSEHRLSFQALCPTFIIFFDIVTGFSSSSSASCLSIAYLFRHRIQLSPIFSGIVSKSLIFPNIVLRSLLVLQSWQLSSVGLQYWVRDKIVSHLGSSLEFISLLHRLYFAPTINSFINSTEEGNICKPSIFSLNTCIYPMGVILTHRSHIAPLWPFRLSRSPSLGWACMWSIECVVHFIVSSWLFFF